MDDPGWVVTRRSVEIFAENPLGVPTTKRLPEGALENVFDVYWWPYGNGYDTMLGWCGEEKSGRERKHNKSQQTTLYICIVLRYIFYEYRCLNIQRGYE
jgi:hypothetical protein